MAVASMAATPTHPPPRCHRQAGGRALGVLAAATTLTGNLLETPSDYRNFGQEIASQYGRHSRATSTSSGLCL